MGAQIQLGDATGALLAGGRAARMGGAPKGLLRVGGEPIAGRTLALFRALFADAFLVVNDPAPYAFLGARTVPDAIPGKGAPGGLHAALSAASTEWIFVAACDMPFVAEPGIRLLAGLRPGCDAVMARCAGRLQPLHAFWSRRCLAPLERMLREGDPSLGDVARAVDARVVEEATWRAIDPLGRAFENANTPEDAARLGLA